MGDSENVAPVSQSDLDAKIVKQMEYYFGNVNLPRDKFLQDKMKLEDGWVHISTLLTFNRLAAICKDAAIIAKALKAAESEVVSVSEDGEKVRRNVGNPLPENSLEYWQKIKHCTVYMKGFEENTSLDQIMEFAAKYGSVDNVLMRRTKPDRIFKGSVFVTYKTREEAEVAQKSEDKFGEIQLTKMMQDDYWTMKNKETKDKRNAEKMAKTSRKAVEHAEKEHAKTGAHFVKGLILAVEGFGEDSSLVSVKEFFKKFGDVGYVVHESGQSKAEIRFAGEENGAKTAWEKAVAEGTDGKVMFQGKELSAKVLEGEEEEAYWTAFNTSKQNKRDRCSGRGGGRGRGGRGRGGGRGNFRGGRGEKRHAEDNGPQGKKTVFEDSEGNPKAEAVTESKSETPAV